MSEEKGSVKGRAGWLILSFLGIAASVYILTDTITYVLGWNNPLAVSKPEKETAVAVKEVKEESPAVLGEETTQVSDYQSVHLTNGKIYLGRLVDEDSQFPVLKEVYYYQKVEEQWQLMFLTDEIKINRDQIVYYEPLKADSPVVKEIEQYQLRNLK